MNKKLIYISNSRMPIELAHGFQVVQMCDAFSRNNRQVELLVPRRVNPIKQDAFSYYKIAKTFEIKKIPCLDFIFLSGKNIFFWMQTISFLFFCRMSLLFKKYDILYTREQMAGLFFCDFVLEIHSLPKRARLFHKMIWKKARRLVVLTSFIKKRLVEQGVAAEKILVAPDGVDLVKFDIDKSKEEARKELNFPPDKKLIGYVGMLRTLGMEKGIDIAIKSIKNLPENARLVLVGGYPRDIEFYKEMAKKESVLDRIVFIGKVGYDLIPLYLKAFDVLIAPFPENEHYNFYMSPMKIFEYMAAKRPIVATDLPSIREILKEESAVLIKPSDAEALASAIGNLLENENLAEKISSQAFEDVKKYTWATRAKMILSFI